MDIRLCPACEELAEFAQNDELYMVCTSCGAVDIHDRDFSFVCYENYSVPYASSRLKRGFVVCRGCCHGRYKEKFHFNERISQWRCNDPEIPVADWKRIRALAESGKYGPKEDFTRATVIMMTRELRLQKYRERWKKILRRLDPDREFVFPSDAFVRFASDGFQFIVNSFYKHRDTMPSSVAKDKSGSRVTKQRHNFMSYNYSMRKQLEAFGDWDFHSEFPLPRSHIKLHALDDVMEKISEELGFEFVRSTVIKRPKYKKL